MAGRGAHRAVVGLREGTAFLHHWHPHRSSPCRQRGSDSGHSAEILEMNIVPEWSRQKLGPLIGRVVRLGSNSDDTHWQKVGSTNTDSSLDVGFDGGVVCIPCGNAGYTGLNNVRPQR